MKKLRMKRNVIPNNQLLHNKNEHNTQREQETRINIIELLHLQLQSAKPIPFRFISQINRLSRRRPPPQFPNVAQNLFPQP